jgi:hypothetical protein
MGLVPMKLETKKTTEKGSVAFNAFDALLRMEV